MGASLILINKSVSNVGIAGHMPTLPQGTIFLWNVPAWNPNQAIPSNQTVPLNYNQTITIPLTSADLLNITNGQLPTVNRNGVVYTQLQFSNTTLQVLGIAGSTSVHQIPPGKTLLAIPSSYIASSNQIITMYVPVSEITAVTPNTTSAVQSTLNNSWVPSQVAGTLNSSVQSTLNNSWVPSQNGGLVSGGLSTSVVNPTYATATSIPNYTMANSLISPTYATVTAVPSYNGSNSSTSSSYTTATPTYSQNSLGTRPDLSVVHFHVVIKDSQIKQTGQTQSGKPIYQIETIQQLIPE